MGGEVVAPPQKRFSCGEFLAGLAIALAAGWIGNGLAAAICGSLFGKYDAHNPTAGVLIGIIPGIILILVSRGVTRVGVRQGMLLMSVFILLSGGLCGGGVAGLFG